MEIILKEDVEHLGFKDDIVKVKNGYGRNYLIPQGFGILATQSAKKVLAENLKQRAFKENKIVSEAKEKAEKLKTLSLKIFAKVHQGDRLFGSISNVDLAKEIALQGVHVDKKFINLVGKTIKRTGKYTASVRLHREVSVDISFEVTAEKK